MITSPYSFVASANCFIYEGATPVFADVDARTLNLDPAAVEAAITPRTKAIVAVDIFGYPCELDPLRELAERHGLALIEDACEALGAEYKGRPVGSHGVDAVFAFYPNKQITTGEGGIVTTHVEETWRSLVSLRNQGRADGGGWLDHARLGFNYRIDDIRAALGIGQLEKLDTILSLRQAAAARYGELLAGVDGLELPLADDADHVRSWFVYVVKLARGIDRERVIAELERAGNRVPRATCRRSTCRRTCASATASAKGSARSRRTSPGGRWRCRSSPRSRPTTRNGSPRRSRPRWPDGQTRMSAVTQPP